MSNDVEKRTDSNKENLEVYTWTSRRCIDLGILLELGSIGAGHAATSLSDVLQQQITIDIPKIHTLPIHQVTKFYHKHDTPTTAIYIQLREESECDILLLFEASEARKIAAMMTMCPSIEELEPAMEASAIEELANILIGAFLSAISDFSGVKLLPTPPMRITDSFDAILDNFLVKQSLVSHEALIFDTWFKSPAGGGNCALLLFPSPELQELLVTKSKELMGCEPEKNEPTIVSVGAINEVIDPITAKNSRNQSEGSQ